MYMYIHTTRSDFKLMLLHLLYIIFIYNFLYVGRQKQLDFIEVWIDKTRTRVRVYSYKIFQTSNEGCVLIIHFYNILLFPNEIKKLSLSPIPTQLAPSLLYYSIYLLIYMPSPIRKI